MSVKIVSSGLLSTIQDLGRIGYQETGFSPSGALDQKALQIANILVNNPKGEAEIEMTLMGATMEFQASNVISVTGGDMNPMLNDKPLPMYAAVAVKQGDILAFGYAKNGCRTYIAFAGGLRIEEVLGSKSTNLKCKIGGFKGKALKAGDDISFINPKETLPNMKNRTLPYSINDNNVVTIRVVLGPQTEYFTKRGLESLCSVTYKVTNESDRMGCKLAGPEIEYRSGVDIISDGIPFGGIQIPPNGLPMVLLADRQTTGGYAKIATIISVDIPAFVQRKPGDSIRFEPIAIRKAQKLYKNEKREIDRFKRKLMH